MRDHILGNLKLVPEFETAPGMAAAAPVGRLTEEQRKAIMDSWALVEPDPKEHGLKFFQQ